MKESLKFGIIKAVFFKDVPFALWFDKLYDVASLKLSKSVDENNLKFSYII